MLFSKYFFPSASYTYNQPFINNVKTEQIQHSGLHKNMRINLYFSIQQFRSITIINFSVSERVSKPHYCKPQFHPQTILILVHSHLQ